MEHLKHLGENDYMVRQNNKTNHIGYVTSGTFRLTRIDTNGTNGLLATVLRMISYVIIPL